VNLYLKNVFNQMEVAIKSVVAMVNLLEDTDLERRPTHRKFSIGELLEHLALICEADRLILQEATQMELEEFYHAISYNNLESIRNGLLANYQTLSEQELFEKTTSYWGVSYSRYEWLLEILAHLYHHRGQLHAILVHYYGKNINVPLFE
jgi:uncharacterized damage-inducible protein DinB